ncbi:Rieske (2Fe-2S) protein [Hwanghaeella sp.]|uniref:Rieske (2Fe-2S) protein n=1 Tax=Hwanghaeella sp. TaxID=2605943 RepID=UPI003CCBA6BF
MSTIRRSGNWVRVTDLDSLIAKGRKVVKAEGKQIALFHVAGRDLENGGIQACNNRCPHEGYPLIEGALSGGAAGESCKLTCNWHNWKFDLDSGETEVGGDKLRRYPVRVEGGEVLVDITDPPPEELIHSALDNIADAMPRHEYDRIAREVARLQKAGGDPDLAILAAVEHSHDRFEYGFTHAFAAAADWLRLGDELAENDAERLASHVEVIGHMSWDSMRERQYPFTVKSRSYDEDGFVQAIEEENEDAAIAYINGALAEGLGMPALRKGLLRAALNHYQMFGHAPIYVYKTEQLSDRLGRDSLKPLLHCLVRGLVYASREDLIPEFKAYRPALETWQQGGDATPRPAADYTRLSVPKVLDLIRQSAKSGPDLYRVLLEAATLQLLHFRVTMDSRTDNSVSDNVNWLDFTHAITFANAGRWAAEQYPELWPEVLLQIGCFLGRNAGFLDNGVDAADWRVQQEPKIYLNGVLHDMLDHSFPEYIVACHYVKLATAMRDEIENDPASDHSGLMTAALNRLIAHPIKRKQVLRTANQSLDFVAREG